MSVDPEKAGIQMSDPFFSVSGRRGSSGESDKDPRVATVLAAVLLSGLQRMVGHILKVEAPPSTLSLIINAGVLIIIRSSL